MGDSLEAGVQQSDSREFLPRRSLLLARLIRLSLTRCLQVLVITMALSFGIDDYIEGGVITAVILLNIVVG